MTEAKGITIGAVVRREAPGAHPEVALLVGRAAARLWRQELHKRPPVQLARKAAGSGSHRMVVYPEGFERTVLVLLGLVRSAMALQARGARQRGRRVKQLPLFRGLA